MRINPNAVSALLAARPPRVPRFGNARHVCRYLLLCFAFTQTAVAQQSLTTQPAGDDSERLPTLSIEAEIAEPIGQVEHADFAGRYTRINAESLSRSEINLADTLAFESGIQQQSVGGFGSFSSITIRASTPAQTGIFLDGVRLNGAANAVIDLSVFDSRSFNSVDVYRGAAPLQLGATNLGGAVNLNSLESGSNITQVKFSAGSFNTLQTHLSHRSKHKAWQSVATVEAAQSDNDFQIANNNATPLNSDDDRRESRHNAAVRSYAVLGKLAYQHATDKVSDVLFQHTTRVAGVPEWRNAQLNDASYGEARGQLHFSHRIQGSSGWSRRHTGFLQWADDHYDDRLSQVGLGAQNFRSQQRVFGASTYWDQFTVNGKWALTAELRQDAFDGEDPLGRDLTVNATRNSLSAGMAYTRFAYDEKILITPRLRFENHDSNWSRQNIQNGADQQNVIVNPELSIRFDPSPHLTWTASLGRYFRIPTFSEMFGTQGLVVGNESLKPEQGINSELGIQWAPSDALSLKATLFHSNRKDTIVAVYDAQGIGRNMNTGAAIISGLELESVWQLTRQLNIKANVTVQDTANQSDISAFFNKQLPNQSALSAYARANFDINQQWQLWADINIAKDRFYDLGNFLPAEDATISNMGVNWQRTVYRASFSLSNLTDVAVQDFNGFPKPGRAAYVSLSYRFK